MSRFASTGTFRYDAASDTFSGATAIILNEQDMPQYPFEEFRDTDEKQYRSKSGQIFSTRNYNKRGFTFNWTDLSESKKEQLATMADSMPILTFESGGTSFGELRMVPGSFESSEALFELYNVSFNVVENS